MSRRNGTFKIHQDKPIKNCGTTVITPRTKGDVPTAKTVRNVHTIDKRVDSFVKDDFLPNDLVIKEVEPPFAFQLEVNLPPTFFASNEPDPLTYQEGKEWFIPKIEDLSDIKDMESSPLLTSEEVDQIVNGPDIPFIEPDVAADKSIINKVELPKLDPVPPISEWEEGVSDAKDVEPSPFTLISDSETEKALNALSPDPIKTVKKHTRGRKKKEEVVSNKDATLSPANNEDIKE